jgi:hypothetical protein
MSSNIPVSQPIQRDSPLQYTVVQNLTADQVLCHCEVVCVRMNIHAHILGSAHS